MRVIPVLDIKSGVAVQALAGRRECYEPVQSVLSSSSDPLCVARAFRDTLGLRQFYVADLDAIAGAPPALNLYRALADLDVELMIDAGVKDHESLASMPINGSFRCVAGLETVCDLAALRRIIESIGSQNTIFSLDLKDASPLGNRGGWRDLNAMDIGREVVAAGINRLIVLDLARVGTQRGIGTEQLVIDLLAAHPELELIVGGGIRTVQDLEAVRRIGAAGILVATALHRGTFDRQVLQAYR